MPEISEEHLDELRKALGALPSGLWEVWEVGNSNSFRRISTRKEGRLGVDGGVLHAYKGYDGNANLSMTEFELKALCRLKNTALEIIRKRQY